MSITPSCCRAGHPAHVFTFGHHREQQPNVLRTSGVRLGKSPFFANVRLNAASARIAASMDLLHIHEPFGIGWVAGRAIARAHGKPYIFTVHTRHDLYIQNWPRAMQRWMQWQARRTVAGFIRASVLTSAPSEDAAQWLRGIAPQCADKIVVRHNGINLAPYAAAIPDADLRRALAIPADHCVFAYVGRLSREKNLRVLLEAFAGALRDGAPAVLLFVGDGPQRQALAQAAAALSLTRHVRFLGDVARQRIPSILMLADVFVTASLSEVNPVTVIEALAAGRPYLGLNAPWWCEFAHMPAAGWLADSTAQLSAMMRDIAAQPEARRVASRAAQLLSRRFDIRDTSAAWAQAYQDVIIRNATDRALARHLKPTRDGDLNESLQS